MDISIFLSFLADIVHIALFTCWIISKKLVHCIIKKLPKSLAGEIILVTGGGNGIGREICRELVKVEPNITLIIWDIDDYEAKGQDVVEELKSLGGMRVHWFQVDVSNRDQVQTGAEQIRREIGNVTVLFNNAGIAGQAGAGWKMDPDRIQKVFEVNLLSNCWTLREFLPSMIANRKGHVVVTNSVLGFGIWRNSSPYIASKHGLRAYIECIKEDLRHLAHESNIIITMAYPHNTNTPLAAVFNAQSTKYPFLLPTLNPKDVGAAIVQGFLRNEEHIYIPGINCICSSIFGTLPSEVFRRICDLTGMTCNDGGKNEA